MSTNLGPNSQMSFDDTDLLIAGESKYVPILCQEKSACARVGHGGQARLLFLSCLSLGRSRQRTSMLVLNFRIKDQELRCRTVFMKLEMLSHTRSIWLNMSSYWNSYEPYGSGSFPEPSGPPKMGININKKNIPKHHPAHASIPWSHVNNLCSKRAANMEISIRHYD